MMQTVYVQQPLEARKVVKALCQLLVLTATYQKSSLQKHKLRDTTIRATQMPPYIHLPSGQWSC